MLDGNYSPEYFLSWLYEIKACIMRVPKYDQVQSIADFLLRGSALELWTKVQRCRVFVKGLFKIGFWCHIKQMLRSIFIALRYCLVRRSTKSIFDYAYEFE